MLTLKRTRTLGAELTRAPRLNAHEDSGLELILETFTHPSLGLHTNNERLSVLGKEIVQLGVTDWLFKRSPALTVEQIQVQREDILQDETLSRWATLNELPGKLRYHPDVHEKIDAPEGHAALFFAYAGAAFCERGVNRTTRWIAELISQDVEKHASALPVSKRRKTASEVRSSQEKPPPYQALAASTAPPQTLPATALPATVIPTPQPPTRIPPPPPISQLQPQLSTWSAQYAQHYPQYQQSQRAAQAMPPFSQWQPQTSNYTNQGHAAPTHAMQNMQLSATATRPNPLAPAQPNLPFLPLFNQTASQRKVTVAYPSSFTGPTHAGRWTIRCVVNGIEKGIGSGPSKGVAKEEAARLAYYAMGWAPVNR